MRRQLTGLVASMIAVTSLIAQNETNVLGNAQNHTVHADGRGNVPTHLPRRGAAAGNAGTTGNGINYNGGSVMLGTTHVYYIWYGTTWTPSSQQILTDFATNVGGSPYFSINTTYFDSSNNNVSNSVTFGGSTIGSLTGSPTALSDSNIWTLVQNALSSNSLPTDPNGVYFVLTGPGVTETSGFLTQYCGWHTYGTYGGTPIKYSFVGNASGPNLYACAAQTGGSPNNDPAADGMVSVIGHELEESVTDPQLNAWYDSSGAENADKCAWTFGTTYNPGNNSSANMRLGSRDYLVQQNWVNASGGYCALSYVSSPDFSLSVSPSSQSVTQGGTTGNYTVTVNPTSGFSGSVNFSVSGLPTGAIANGPSSTTSTSSFSVGTSSTTPTGTYTFTITGTSGSLTHTATAKLTVNPNGSFSISIAPTSLTVRRGTSGSYTVTVTPNGSFNSSVQLSISGLPSRTSAGFSPSSIPAGSTSSTLTISPRSNASATTRTITVTGVSGQLSSSKTAILVIQ
jgi:hypothetical protein